MSATKDSYFIVTHYCNSAKFISVGVLGFGCGNTLVEKKNIVEIINKNSVTLRTSEFKLTKLNDGLACPARLAAPILRV